MRDWPLQPSCSACGGIGGGEGQKPRQWSNGGNHAGVGEAYRQGGGCSMRYMLRTEPHADNARRQTPQYRITSEHTDCQRRLWRGRAAQHIADDALLDQHLHALRQARRQLAAALYGTQIVQRGAALAQARDKNIGRGDSILDRQVDSYATDWRHSVRGIADAQQARTAPGVQAVHRDSQQFHIVPRRKFVHAIPQKRRKLHNVRAERVQSASMHFVDTTLGNNEGTLPIVATVQHDEDTADIDVTERLT